MKNIDVLILKYFRNFLCREYDIFDISIVKFNLLFLNFHVLLLVIFNCYLFITFSCLSISKES